jgi:dihydrolipoamide dehydrogenase
MAKQFDIAIIGGGPGGYVAAIHATHLGAKVAIVEKERLGGVCLNKGCIPTKAIVRSIEILLQIKEAGRYGILVGEPRIEFVKLMAQKEEVVENLVSGVEALVEANGIEVIYGKGEIIKPGFVRIRGANREQEIYSKKIIIATGSVPTKPPIPGLELEGVLTSDDALKIDEIPSSLVIVGGGVIGIEFASIFSALGTKVTVLEMLPDILPPVDRELSRRLLWLLRRNGVDIRINSLVKRIEPKEKGLSVKFESKRGEGEIDAEKVLVAAGRIPYTEGLNLEDIGIRVESGAVSVDERMETSVPGIYAIGDVTGGVMLAHVASHQGRVAVENALGYERRMDYRAVPNCVFSFPEIASVGLTEQEAKGLGVSYKVSRFPLSASGRALTLGETIGLVKMICEEETGKVLGLHIMGPYASELIAEGALAIRLGAPAREISETIHAHPTLSEAIMEAAMGQLEGAIHLLIAKS